ncbi:hypothetical protein BGZ47_000984 [Haplosporangium gracile]|nr:hypothetical protein BGZ47_000984 [Haplosporangium gracile]
MPELSSSSSDDGDLQDDQDSENDSDIHDPSPLATAQYGDGDDNIDVSTPSASEADEDEDTEDSDVSETDEDEVTEDSDISGTDEDEDEDTEDSDGDENNDDHSQDEDNEEDIGSPVVKSYFDSMKSVVKGDVAAATIQLKCTKTESDRVPIDFRSKSVEWTLYPHELDSTKDYELVIGISAKNLHIVDIEEVVFTVNGVEERVEQESLKDEELDEAVVLRWKLATPKTVHNNNRMEMEVGFALKLKPMVVPLETQTFNLYYMELHAVGTMNSSMDPFVRVHRPFYDWALDIRRNGTDDTIPYAISESGDYLVTYRTAIELWELTDSSTSTLPNSFASTDPFSISAAELEHLGLSVSWGGSQIAVSGTGSPFKLFELNRPKSMLEKSTKAKIADLVKFEGRGSFHKGAERQRQGQDDEVFVAVGKDTINIYRVCGAWEFLRTIRHTSPRTSDMILDARSTSRGFGDRFQDRHFICRNMDTDVSETEYETESIFIWNLDSGRLVRTIKADGIVCDHTESLSSDASLLLEEVDGVMSSFCSRSGVRLATSGYEIGSAVPVRGGTTTFHTSDGLIRSGIDFSPMYPSCKLTESARVLWISKEGESFKAFVEDSFRISRHTWKSSPCNTDCLANLYAARKNVLSFIDFESRLQFSVRDNVSSSVRLVITDLSRKKVSRVLVLEKKSHGTKWNHGDKWSVTFSPKERALIVGGGELTCVYEMPRRFREDISLVSIQDPQDQHLICIHERSYFGFRQSFSSLLQLKKNQLAAAAPALFRQTWWHHISVNVYLPRYINRHINQRDGCGDEEITQGNLKFSMMERLCEQWDRDEYPIQMMLKQVLGLPEFQWVPQLNKGFNPVQYFLDKTKTEGQAKAVFNLLSDYCH